MAIQQPPLDKVVTEAVPKILAHKNYHAFSYEEMGFTRQQIEKKQHM